MEPVRVELMPGVFLTTVRAKKFKTSYWSLRLLTPLKKETAALNALLPYVLRRGTSRHPDVTGLNGALEELYGGAVEPAVEKKGEVQCIGFDAAFLDDALVPGDTGLLEHCARLLGELLLHPATKNGRLRSDYVKSEQENLVRRIRSIRDDKTAYATQRLMEEMYAGEDFAVSRLGTEEAAAKIHVAKLFGHYQTLLEQSVIELYYCGSASHRRVELAWREALMGLPRAFDIYHPRWDCHRQWLETPRVFADTMDVLQGKMAMGFTVGYGRDDPAYPALLVANAMFGGTPDSRLFVHVREKRSLCYRIQSSVDGCKGLVLVSCGVDGSMFDAVREEVLNQLGQLQRGEFSAEEFESAKGSVINSFRSALDDQQRMGALWLQHAAQDIAFDPVEFIRRLEEVTPGQVSAACMELSLDSIYTLAGPDSQEGAQA